MTNISKREFDRAVREYQQQHPGTSLSAARRAVERQADQPAPMPRRLALVPAPHDGEMMSPWVDRVAAANQVGRHQMMELLGLEPTRSAAERLRQLTEDMPDRTAERLCAATGLTPEHVRAMTANPVEVLPFDDIVEYVRTELERERTSAQAQGLPVAAGWSLPFTGTQITRLGGAQTLKTAAKNAARRLRISVRVTIYGRDGDPQQLVAVNNQGPYKTPQRTPQDTAAAAAFMPAPDTGPSGAACDCGRGYCLSGSATEYARSPWPEPVWNSIRRDTDLRTLPEEYRRRSGMHLLFARLDRHSIDDYDDVLDLTPFLVGADLGPLADVQVYATNARGKYRGSSHGALCRHADTQDGAGYGPLPSERHEILTLAELIDILRPLQRTRRAEDLHRDQDLEGRWCVYCHGYSVRRFTTAEQCSHYRTAHERWLRSPAQDEPATGPLARDPMLDVLTLAESALQSPGVQRIFDAHDRELEQQAQQALDIACPHCSAAPGSDCTDSSGRPTLTHRRRRMAADRARSSQ
ncbi:TniQ family protein [Kitasatospora sp. NPDC051164]|uniref:TniQ family protein n=1 Tax=Kitasatospora sp. NPDC051164 TaxID=3364055 RepID=UPI0037B8FAF4